MPRAPLIVPLDWSCSPAELAGRWPADQALLWLHSGRLNPRWARWSILASPRAVFRFDGRSRMEGEPSPGLAQVTLTGDALRDLDAVLTATSHDKPARPRDDSSPPFRGGWIGFFSYDLACEIEPRAQHNRSERSPARSWPLIELAWCPDALAFDHELQQWSAITNERADRDRRRIAARAWRFNCGAPYVAAPGSRSDPAAGPRFDAFSLGEVRTERASLHYEAMVARALDYIAAGDVFQANIAQRFGASFEGSTRALAMAAFAQAQPWYGAYLELAHPARDVLSLSPELFLHIDPRSRAIITRPIKGTRPVSCDVRELRESAKDQAELNMIVDLMRNDLGRICEYGSVRVTQPRIIETHPTVHHGVAEIIGTLREGVRCSDLLRATFPPGSVTGAPKIRAMQIIDELERTPRGLYCGAIGFISDCGTMTLNVAIRTMLIEGRRHGERCDALEDGSLSYSAGAGIVADSVPAHEQQETCDKAAVLRAIVDEAVTSDPGRRDACHETVTITRRRAPGTTRSAPA